MNDLLKYYLPLELIKGKDQSGKEIMKMRGIASTTSEDTDGETLQPTGFKLDYFLKSGYINWNHQTNQDPLSIIGRPTKAQINKANELEIEFNLFGSSKKASQVWELQKALQKEGLGLGLSIEGKVLKRNEKNKKIVEKALLTGCAVTPNPKNSDTTLQIIKSNHFEYLEDIFIDDNDSTEKSLEAGHQQGGDTDNSTNFSSLKKESIEKDEKKKKLKKSEIISFLQDEYPELENKSIDGLYKLIVHNQKLLDMAELDNNKGVTKEAIEKALASLGLEDNGTSQADDTVEKGQTQTTSTSAEDNSANTGESEKEILHKALEILEKGKFIKKEINNEGDEEEDEEEEEEDDDEGKEKKGEMKKSESSNNSSDLLKSIQGLFAERSQKDDERFKAMGTLIKGVMVTNESLTQRIDELESQPIGRRSVGTKSYIQKSNNEDDLNKGGGNVLSISADKHKIMDQIEKSMSPDDWNSELGKSISDFEISGSLNTTLISKAQELGLSLVN